MNDTVIFLVLAGLALIFKWLTSQASGDAGKPKPPPPNERPQPQPQPQRPPADSDAERVRRFLEALGAPPGTQPPPPVQPRPVTPAPRTPVPKVKRSWAQPLPPLVTTPEDMPLPPLTTAPPEPAVFEAAPPPPIAVAPPPLPEPIKLFQPAPPLPRKAAPPRLIPLSSLGAMLRSARTARQAIMLREVLGPPRGLQALDDLRSF
jgi:hypothetical protein